jgi:hypothetical protein
VSNWQENWAAVESAVRAAETRGEAVSKAGQVLGRKVTWDGLQRSWKRQTGESILGSLGSGIYNDGVGGPKASSEILGQGTAGAEQRVLAVDGGEQRQGVRPNQVWGQTLAGAPSQLSSRMWRSPIIVGVGPPMPHDTLLQSESPGTCDFPGEFTARDNLLAADRRTAGSNGYVSGVVPAGAQPRGLGLERNGQAEVQGLCERTQAQRLQTERGRLSQEAAQPGAVGGIQRPQGLPRMRKGALQEGESKGLKICVIPDTQVRPGVPLEHFKAMGRYIAAKQPDVVIHLGDHWDYPSLSSYESKVQKAKRGRCKLDDIESGNVALEMLEEELVKGNAQPLKILLRGNHDDEGPHGRIGRYLAEYPEDARLFEKAPRMDTALGWQVFPFLQPVEVGGILFSHLFPFSAKGTITAGSMRMGAASAAVQIKNVMQSCIAGHRQGLESAIHYTPSGAMRGIIAGSAYLHDEEYLGPQQYWRGILMLHDVRPDNPNHFDLMEVSLDYLMRRYQ